MTPRVEQIDTRTAPEATLRALNDLYDEWDLEWRPSEPMTPMAQRLVHWRHVGEFVDVPRWIISEDGRVVATAGLFLYRTQDLENSFGWVYVRPDWRGQGLGKALLSPTVDYAIGDGRKRYMTVEPAGGTHTFWPERIGIKAVYNERVSQLRTADVDRALMREWIVRASERAEDYEIRLLRSPIPDEFVKKAVNVAGVMNNAPLEDLEEDPIELTVEEWRQLEDSESKRQREILGYFAVHKPTGDFVGYTNVAYQNLHPKLAYQWDTGVDPAHQNRGLGRWLKAAMIELLLDQYPAIEVIETENAESNDPMLNINVAMGYKPAHEQVIYQGDIQNVADYLA
jgi:GNAT superfamily N-acetyltransferase